VLVHEIDSAPIVNATLKRAGAPSVIMIRDSSACNLIFVACESLLHLLATVDPGVTP
jgi:hypothetical protein